VAGKCGTKTLRNIATVYETKRYVQTLSRPFFKLSQLTRYAATVRIVTPARKWIAVTCQGK